MRNKTLIIRRNFTAPLQSDYRGVPISPKVKKIRLKATEYDAPELTL